MEYYLAIKKERTTDIHNNTDELQIPHTSERSQSQRVVIPFMQLLERTNYIVMKNRLVSARDQDGWEKATNYKKIA